MLVRNTTSIIKSIIVLVMIVASLPLLAFTYPNPLVDEASTLAGFIKLILEMVFNVGVLILGMMLVYSGYLFITARGNEQQLSRAKKNFVWVLMGGALLLGAWALSIAIGELVKTL